MKWLSVWGCDSCESVTSTYVQYIKLVSIHDSCAAADNCLWHRKWYVQYEDSWKSHTASWACYCRIMGHWREESDSNLMTWCLGRDLGVAGRLCGAPLPAWTIGLDRAVPQLEDQRAVVLVSVLVYDAGLVVTVNKSEWELHSKIQQQDTR